MLFELKTETREYEQRRLFRRKKKDTKIVRVQIREILSRSLNILYIYMYILKKMKTNKLFKFPSFHKKFLNISIKGQLISVNIILISI